MRAWKNFKSLASLRHWHLWQNQSHHPGGAADLEKGAAEPENLARLGKRTGRANRRSQAHGKVSGREKSGGEIISRRAKAQSKTGFRGLGQAHGSRLQFSRGLQARGLVSVHRINASNRAPYTHGGHCDRRNGAPPTPRPDADGDPNDPAPIPSAPIPRPGSANPGKNNAEVGRNHGGLSFPHHRRRRGIRHHHFARRRRAFHDRRRRIPG